MFINYANDTISIWITAHENIGVFEMLAEEMDVEELIEAYPLGSESSATWELRVPPGAIVGFGVRSGVSYTNPDPEHLTILTASGKSPWPPPPPPPPLFERVEDYEERYGAFLMALATRRTRPERAA